MIVSLLSSQSLQFPIFEKFPLWAEFALQIRRGAKKWEKIRGNQLKKERRSVVITGIKGGEEVVF